MPAGRRHAPRAPLWVRAIVAVTIVGAPLAWLVQWRDRTVNEQRLGAIASQIAGRSVTVHCPGVIGRALRYDIVEGTVAFDAAGRPADEARLRALPCAELDALAEGRRATVLDCVARGGSCGQGEDDVAVALDVLTHESFHLAGYAGEAEAECRSLRTMAWTAERLGVAAGVAGRLAAWEASHAYARMPAQYKGDCRLTGQDASRAGR